MIHSSLRLQETRFYYQCMRLMWKLISFTSLGEEGGEEEGEEEGDKVGEDMVDEVAKAKLDEVEE